MAMTDIQYERMKILGHTKEFRKIIEQYKSDLEAVGTEEDQISLLWAKKACKTLKLMSMQLTLEDNDWEEDDEDE